MASARQGRRRSACQELTARSPARRAATGARRRVVRGGARRDRRAPGAERRGQDHADADPDRVPGAQQRRCRAGRPFDPRREPGGAAAGRVPARRGAPLPGHARRRVSAYRARLRGVARGERRRRIDSAVEDCGLGDRRRQIIGTLSRGYRQRVGLADAILARPPILILDEPTAGLDPNQIREVRALVRTLARERDGAAVDAHPVRGRGAGGARDHPASRPGGRDARRRAQDGAAARVIVRTRRRGSRARTGDLRGAARRRRGRRARRRAAGDHAARERSRRADLAEEVFRAAAAAGMALRELGRESSSLEEIFAASPPAARTRPMRNVPAVARAISPRTFTRRPGWRSRRCS